MKKRDDYPTYEEIINTPRPANMWRPFQANGKYSKAQAIAANAGVLIAFALQFAFVIGAYAGCLWLTNACRDSLIEMLPGCAGSADLIAMALKALATTAVAWCMKFCWVCVPYVLNKLREEADQLF
ncbi:hypothetical protein C7401_15441 [Paraburkholderia unamae]|uniref:hypothetical protein n=1 Tax=Paraburkholderia unamae TaxID=219649 RepID=UPI000DC46B96|nr:hypothetical protein [Paraburkholderia unamae]RAR48000.1 hypothetical protein C7401_15441 [Paraburkholderia unamae]